MKIRCLFLLILLIWAWLPGRTHARNSQTIIVFAASSLTDAFEEIGAAFETEHPGIEVVFNFGSSSSLAAQLSEGAPADVFASANLKQMQAAQDSSRINGSPHIFAHNRLALIVPSDNPAGIGSVSDLAKPGVLLVLAAPGVPVRDYTETMLDRMGENTRQAVLANVVSEEDNVRQVVAKVALGEADAGIVYLSDVTPDIAPDVRLITVPDDLNTIADYPIAITDDASGMAQSFVDFVLSEAGQNILARWGFVPIRPQLARVRAWFPW